MTSLRNSLDLDTHAYTRHYLHLFHTLVGISLVVAAVIPLIVEGLGPALRLWLPANKATITNSRTAEGHGRGNGLFEFCAAAIIIDLLIAISNTPESRRCSGRSRRFGGCLTFPIDPNSGHAAALR